jgi:hypothetical protein
MIRNVLTFSVAIVACAMMSATTQAQCSDCSTPVSDCGGAGCGGSAIGGRLAGKLGNSQIKGIARDSFSPHRVYSHSPAGGLAQSTHDWNNNMHNVYSWHGGYQNWRWGTPTALVVPPTASYHTSYAWGVGQTRSTPIHHQFGRGNAAMIGGGNGSNFSWTPYWPQSTNQFGIYPVRGPW